MLNIKDYQCQENVILTDRTNIPLKLLATQWFQMNIIKQFISMASVMCWFLFLVFWDKIPDKELLRQGFVWAPNLRRVESIMACKV